MQELGGLPFRSTENSSGYDGDECFSDLLRGKPTGLEMFFQLEVCGYLVTQMLCSKAFYFFYLGGIDVYGLEVCFLFFGRQLNSDGVFP